MRLSSCLAVFFTGYFRHWHTVPGCARCAHSRHPSRNRRELMKIEYSPQSETACKPSRHSWPSKYHSCWGRWVVISNGDLRRQPARNNRPSSPSPAAELTRIRPRPRTPTPQPPRRDASAGDVAEGRRVAAEGHRVGAAADAAAASPEKVGAGGGGDIEISPSADTRRQRRQRLHNIDSGYVAPTPLRRDQFSQRPKCEHRLRIMMIGAGR
jgi:hypothetical protein